MSLRIVQFGLGPIGQACARLALDHGHTIVGALDLDPGRVGRDVGEVLGREPVGATVRDDADAALAEWAPDVVLHTTLSFLDRIEGQLLACVAAGAHVVSSSEELFWPFDRDPGFCERVDAAAREAGVSVVGTGVNPGFVMDLFPVVLANSVVARVDRVDVSRSVDAGRRRGPLQKKVGAGLSVAAFREREAAGGFGHIGMVESAKALAAGLGWAGAEVTETFGPHLADADHTTPHATVAAGDVAGIHQTATVTLDGETRATLRLTMAVGAPDEDRVAIAGDPPLTVVVEGGTFGDTATVAAVVNAARRIGAARPGLRTVLDLPAAAV
ncbi:dihydrodipicolinate reductase [Rubrivirga sp. IMCC45206]|uniref:NAD(P)H-dependent amine dehydrogenase family protein n=1 Tax=Rubrivirga sp. IMCC45206 TaxID=3391614 RepID=UPI0039902114